MGAMLFGNIRLMLLIFSFLLPVMASCTRSEMPLFETEMTDNEPIPVERAEIEDGVDEETNPKEYSGWVGAYLEILRENRIEIEETIGFEISGASSVAILDVFGDETPELLYIYHYDDPDYFGDYVAPCLFLKILSYSEARGIESSFNSIVFIAAGGPDNYCVYLTREGELMLYRSASGLPGGWGIWQILPNTDLEKTDDYYPVEYSSDLARLYYAFFDNKIVYKKNGKEISKEQYDETVKEIKENIESVIFQGFDNLYDEELWNDITPLKAESMTYVEAIAWLEAQK